MICAELFMNISPNVRKKKNNDAIVVFDFFCGCGGTSLGFKMSGMKIVWALDNNPVAAHTYHLNFPDVQFHCKNIEKMSDNDLRPLFDKYKKSIRLFCGCAPCQPFTKQKTQKKSKDQDSRYPLLISFAEIIKQYTPELVFIENVPGVQYQTADEPGPFQTFLNTLKELNYRIKYGVVKAQDYGAAQIRHRFILLASKVSDISLPPITHGETGNKQLKKYVTVRDKIADLPPIAAGQTFVDPNGKIYNHKASSLSELNLKRIQATSPDGGNRLNWPDNLQLKCHLKQTIKISCPHKKGKSATYIGAPGHTDVYGRLWWDRPATGLTTRCNSYSNGRFGHPEQDRAISIREAARLQGFSDSFIFTGSIVDMARQIGNAVPIPLAMAVGQHFNSILFCNNKNRKGRL